MNSEPATFRADGSVTLLHSHLCRALFSNEEFGATSGFTPRAQGLVHVVAMSLSVTDARSWDAVLP